MDYLRQEDLILINRMTVRQHGGNFVPPNNILHIDGLVYVIEAVQGELFGQEMYPEIYDKAAVYMYTIISNHVFQDGNKRTGLEAALLFLRLNRYRLQDQLTRITFEDKEVPRKGNTSNDILYQFTMELASGILSLEACQEWFKANIVQID